MEQCLSVIIPYYNERIFLRQTVYSALCIGHALKEIVVVNDGANASEKLFLATIDSLDSRIKVFHNSKNIGAAGSRNAGLKYASGRYVHFLDSDDIVSPKSLNNALAFMQKSGDQVLHLPTNMMSQSNGTFLPFPRDKRLFVRRKSGKSIDEIPELRHSVASWSFLFDRAYLDECNVRFDSKQPKFEDHLFIISMLQHAERIGIFDEYAHLWRHRGGSYSSAKMSFGDYTLQIASVEKSLEFLTQQGAVDRVTMQREIAFCFSRFLTTWSLLPHCLLYRGIDVRADKTLADLARSLEPYSLDASIASDPLLMKIFRTGVQVNNGLIVTLDLLPNILNLVRQGNWDQLKQVLEIDMRSTKESLGLGRAKASIFRVFRNPSAENHLRISAQKTQNTYTPLDLEDGLICSEICLGSPSSLLLEAYELRLDDPSLHEERLFSEFIADEAIGLVDLIESLNNRIRADDSVQISFSKDEAPSPEKMQSLIFKALCKKDTRAQHALPDNNIEQSKKLKDSSLGAIASAELFDYSFSCLEQEGTNSRAKALAEICHSWRLYECSVWPELEDSLARRLVKIANEARFGNANWFGKVNWKSRLRHQLKRNLN